MNIYAQRLLNVARSLRETTDAAMFSMAYTSRCGTPCCALGNYAARGDLQQEFSLLQDALTSRLVFDGTECLFDSSPVINHFDLSDDEFEELFGGWGCEDAKRPIDAAEYIEGFVARKWPKPDPRPTTALLADLMTKVLGERIAEDA